MEQISSKIKERVIQFAKYKGITLEDFFPMVGQSYGNYKGRSKGTALSSDSIAEIASIFPELNIEWLIMGTGHMVKQDSPQIQQLHHPKAIETVHEEQSVNLYDFEASAGLRTLFDNGRANVIDTIRIPNLPKCDGAIHIVGDSMYPILKSGDIVLYKEINLDMRNIYWGETYLLSYYEDDEDVAVVIKYVQRSEEPGCVKLVSHNAHHAPRDIEFSRVNAMAIVKASIRINSMY